MATPITDNEFSRCEAHRRVLSLQSRPIRTVLGWQVVASVVCALLAGYVVGFHGALSAALGGLVSLAAGIVFAIVVSLGSKSPSLEGTLLRALRAEAAKIGTIVVLLGLVFATYSAVVAFALIGAFAVTVIIFSLAFFVRDV
jgi:ATP synthase protein I